MRSQVSRKNISAEKYTTVWLLKTGSKLSTAVTQGSNQEVFTVLSVLVNINASVELKRAFYTLNISVIHPEEV